MLYAVFFVDFGEREHVFMPVGRPLVFSGYLHTDTAQVRRWAMQQKAAFFTLSSAELEMIQSSNRPLAPTSPPEPAVTSSVESPASLPKP